MHETNKIMLAVVASLDQRRKDPLGNTPASPASSVPFCPTCKNAGYLRANVPFGDPLFGKPIECACTTARKRAALRQALWEQSNLAAFQEENFENFQFWRDGVQKAFDASEAYAKDPKGWFSLQGINGCGKTHLAVSIAKYCINDGRIVLFMNVPDLLDTLRQTFEPGEESFADEFAKMREVEILILDDLGAESPTSWAREKLYRLLDFRYNRKLPTVVTTNCIDFVGFEGRLRSRLRDIRLVQTVVMNALDFREQEA